MVVTYMFNIIIESNLPVSKGISAALSKHTEYLH